MLRKIFAGILIILSTFTVKAQESGNMVYFDKVTYQHYQDKNWEQVISEGDKALQAGFDFFYLRMRIGIAWFEKENYRKAIPHFKKAWEMNQNDRYANEYLYYSYLYGGRKADAARFRQQIPDVIKDILFDQAPGFIASLSVNYSTSSNPEDYTRSSFSQSGQSQTSSRSLLKNFHFMNPMVTLRLSNLTKITVGYGLLSKTNHYYINSAFTQPLYTEQEVNQSQIYLAPQISLGYGWVLWAGYHHVSLDVPLYYEGADYGLTPGFYPYTYEQSDNLVSIGLTAEAGRWRLSPYVNYSTLNEKTQVTPGLHMTLFPGGNLNFYTTSTASGTFESMDGTRDDTRLNLIQEIGFKTFNNLWLEAGFSLGNIRNYSPPGGAIIYNSPNTLLQQYSGKVILLLNQGKIKLFGLFQYNQYLNEPVPSTMQSQTIEFNAYTISTGFEWNF